MNCSHCPDREVCLRFASAGENTQDYARLREAYLRTLRCRRQRFG
ncbi:MAG: hypothetical protein PHV05_05990 [Candidatus Riflebacteria bacterium]|nr:hypothetical protein [Candidatus Riflebacteria bacterium]